jgi:hypothetical protein
VTICGNAAAAAAAAAAGGAVQAKYREALAAGLDGEGRVDAAFGLVSEAWTFFSALAVHSHNIYGIEAGAEAGSLLSAAECALL